MPTAEEKSNTPPAFIADCHLGKLAKYLRLMGFDTLYFTQIDDNALVDLAREEERIILTRDRALSQQRSVPVLFLESPDTAIQLRMLMEHFRLKEHPAPFSRCIVCNTLLRSVDKEKVLQKVPEKIGRTFSEFKYCSRCDRVYWKGDHYRRMERFLAEMLKRRDITLCSSSC